MSRLQQGLLGRALRAGFVTGEKQVDGRFDDVGLCDKVEGASAASGPNEDQMRRQLVASKLARYSASLLRKLRREAGADQTQEAAE